MNAFSTRKPGGTYSKGPGKERGGGGSECFILYFAMTQTETKNVYLNISQYPVSLGKLNSS